MTKNKVVMYLLILTLMMSSCAGSAPKLNRSYLPLRYKESSVSWSLQIEKPFTLYLVPINLDKGRNQRLIAYWRNGFFDPLFKKRHPVLKMSQLDISNLDIYLNKVLRIYYVVLELPSRRPSIDVKRIVGKHIRCEPLSNLEIRFIMNADTMTVFSQKPLTMLIISAHELMLQMGSIPEYPKVISPYLRKKYGYSELKNIEDGNIFAVKKSDITSLQKHFGFVVCRRED